jgi:hypothetical protein
METTEKEYRCQECRPLTEPIKIEVTVKGGEIVQYALVHVDNHCHLVHVKIFDG